MKTADVIIVGGGMVGLALAGLLADTDCQIKIIETAQPEVGYSPQFSYRVSAINGASQQMLQRIGAWQAIPETRLSSYSQMMIWEKDSFAKIHFDNDELTIKQLGLSQLGFIVENTLIRSALWQKVSQQKNVEIILSKPINVGVSDNGVFLTLEQGEMLTGKLLIGADSANSWVRKMAQIPLTSKDYQHTALVCNVRTAEPHQHTAQQVFDKESILAFLPLSDPNICSIVWSLPPDKAEEYLSCDTETFNKMLNIAFDNQLGLCELVSDRAIYPLTARYARDFTQPRIALMGDAAHTIHPLAGLGVNLGFGDAVVLANTIKSNLDEHRDIGLYRNLRHFERVRKVEATKMLFAMEGLKQLFSGDHPMKKLIRGVGLMGVNQITPLKKIFIELAAGIR